MNLTSYAVEFSDILEAAQRLQGVAHRTAVISSQKINTVVGADVFFKCENFQKVGAFKFRGAWNAVSQLSEVQAQKGICTHSSGNHAQAIALAAQKRNIPAYIVMPSSSPIVKKQAVKEYGANIIECEPNLSARESTTHQVQVDTGAHFIHPYNHPDVIAGQGTAALELLQDTESLDLMIAPIGGGGLMSGTCISTRHVSPNTEIWGSEPQGADDAAQSFQSKTLIPQTNPQTICDGLLTSMGDLTWPIIRDHVTQVLTVSDDEVRAAMRLIWTRMKIIIEPSCAVPLAALIKYPLPPSIKRIGVILSGGNVDLDRLPW